MKEERCKWALGGHRCIRNEHAVGEHHLSTPTTLTKQIVVRVDVPLYDALIADAEANGRTVAKSVRLHLRRALS